jgi:hypothetical protein
MGIAAFLLFIVVCFGFLMWLSSRSNGRKELSATRRQLKTSKDDKLYTPADNVLAHRNRLWQERQRAARSDVTPTNRFTPKSESLGEPEYDGYSRRDRHHLTSGPTHVKDEGHADSLSAGPAH